MRSLPIAFFLFVSFFYSLQGFVNANEIQSADGRVVIVKDTSKIVSIGSSVTELIYEFGLEDTIVAVDTTSLYPPIALKEKPNVGYLRRLSAEGILALNPTVILAIEGAGPPDVFDVLSKTSIPVVIIPNNPTPKGVIDKILLMSKILNVPNQGDVLAQLVERDFKKLEEARNSIKQPHRLLFAVSLREGKVLASGKQTIADGIMKLAGAVNSIQSFEGFKPLNDEAIVSAAPHSIMVMKRQGFDITSEEVFSLPAFKTTPAAENKTLLKVDPSDTLSFGPRTAQAARDLARQLYPDLSWPELESDKRYAGH